MIACHGQTIWFRPQPKAGEVKSTLQMCEATVLAQRFGKTIVTDFRPAEQAAGRQGAPIACFQDALELIHPTLNRANQNIGGIANVAFVPSEKDGQSVASLHLDDTEDWHLAPKLTRYRRTRRLLWFRHGPGPRPHRCRGAVHNRRQTRVRQGRRDGSSWQGVPTVGGRVLAESVLFGSDTEDDWSV